MSTDKQNEIIENEVINDDSTEEINDEDVVELEAEFDDDESIPAPKPHAEGPNEPTLFGWFFWWMLICIVPVIGFISAALIARKTKNISKKRFLHAGMVWNVLIILIGFLTFEGVKSTVKGYDNMLHSYLGDYGSTLELADKALSGDWEGALSRIDFEKMFIESGFTFKDIPSSVPMRELLAMLDFDTILNETDFARIDWDHITDEQLQALYDALPKNRIKK